MQYDEIQSLLDTSPEFRLLAATSNAPLVISFLNYLYKEQANAAIPEQHFVDELASYCDHLKKSAQRHQNTDLSFKPAKDYLNDWKKRSWVREHRTDRDGDYEIRLTQYTERVLKWMRDMQHREYVATESRFQSIIQQLNELVIASSQDVDVQLQYLEKQQAETQRKIDTLKQTGQPDRLDEHTIRGQFTLIEEMARQLISDFALVEDRFHEMGQQVQAAQLQKKQRHGEVVSNVMASDEQLRESTIGRSFFTFWRFLNARGQKDNLDRLLEAVLALPEITPQQKRQSIVRRLTHHLHEAGDKVNESTRRLFAQLNRLLEEQTREENQRVRDLINEVKLIQAQNPHWFDESERWLEMELYPENVQLPLERPIYEYEETIPFEPIASETDTVNSFIALHGLQPQFYVEEWVLEQHIEDILEQVDYISLSDLLYHYPPQKGLPEVFTYVQLAMRSERHEITFDELETLDIASSELARHTAKQIDLPRIVFRRRLHEA